MSLCVVDELKRERQTNHVHQTIKNSVGRKNVKGAPKKKQYKENMKASKAVIGNETGKKEQISPLQARTALRELRNSPRNYSRGVEEEKEENELFLSPTFFQHLKIINTFL